MERYENREYRINIRKHIIHTVPKHLLQKGMPYKCVNSQRIDNRSIIIKEFYDILFSMVCHLQNAKKKKNQHTPSAAHVVHYTIIHNCVQKAALHKANTHNTQYSR